LQLISAGDWENEPSDMMGAIDDADLEYIRHTGQVMYIFTGAISKRRTVATVRI